MFLSMHIAFTNTLCTRSGSRKEHLMINRSRSRHVLLIACGFLLLLLAIVELIDDNHVDNIVVTSWGIYLIVTNGYAYLRPGTTSSTRALLAALGGFLLCF